MLRTLAFLLLSTVLVGGQSPRTGSLDPAFRDIPFEQWLSEAGPGRLHWTASIVPAALSFHQRLLAKVQIRVEGRDLETRRGKGQLMFFTQITDGGGALYQDHGRVELDELDEQVKRAAVQYTEPAFFLPGDYRVAVAILDTTSGEHSARTLPLHIGAEREELLRHAWRELPPVEFIGDEKSLDAWYLPKAQGRVGWAAPVQSPAAVHIILNVPHRSRDLASLLPTLKVLAENGSPAVSTRIELLDLARQRVIFDQDGVPGLDWPKVRAGLEKAISGAIDVRALVQRHGQAQFFAGQVRRAVLAPAGRCAVVVLSDAMSFEPGEDLHRIPKDGSRACRVFYLRFRDAELGPRGRWIVDDRLADTLKPLHPRVFDVENPKQVTKVLVELERMLAAPGAR